MANVLEISDIISRDVDENFGLTIPKIAHSLRYVFLGKINNLLDLDITLNSNLDFSRELTNMESSILIELYFIRYYEKLIESSLGAGSYEVLQNQWVTMQEGDTRISRINRVNIAQEYKALKDSRQQRLNDLVWSYRQNNSVILEEKYETDESC